MRLKAFKVTGPHAPKISVWDVDCLDCKVYRENYDKIDWGHDEAPDEAPREDMEREENDS